MNARLFLVAAITASLTGCGDDPAELARKRDAACRSWGAAPGSSTYVQCRATLEANATRKQREDDSTATAIALGGAIGAASSGGQR